MLDWYKGECMVSINNIPYDIKESTHGYQNCSISQILISHGERIFVYLSYYLGHYSKPY